MVNKLQVQDYISYLPLYANSDSYIINIVEKFTRFKINKIAIVDDNFCIMGAISVQDIIENIKKNDIESKDIKNYYKKTKVSQLEIRTKTCPSAYPNTGVDELCRVMNATRANYFPIVNNPWTRTLIGFVERHNIKCFCVS